MYLALNCKKVADKKLDSDEIIECITFNYNELFELEKLGYITGVNAKLALEKLKKYMEER